jgi:hypothetical protein
VPVISSLILKFGIDDPVLVFLKYKVSHEKKEKKDDETEQMICSVA